MRLLPIDAKVAGMVAATLLLPLGEYAELLESAGLRMLRTERHTPALTRMALQIGARLELLQFVARPRAEALGVDLDRVGPALDAARGAVADGTLDYVLLVAQKPCA